MARRSEINALGRKAEEGVRASPKRRRPYGWPRYMRARRLKNGTAYFWEPRTADRKSGCPVHAEALGTNLMVAYERAEMLNRLLDAWRSDMGVKLPEADRRFGTVAWAFREYMNSDAFRRDVSERSKPEYRRAMQRIEDVATRHGGRVGDLPALSITPAAVDKIYVKLQEGPRGRRIRQANMSLDIARIVWSVVRRTYPDQFGTENPWVGVRRIIETTTKPAATRAEAYALAYSLRDIGEPHLGAAALICFEWHQRPEHVRAGDITWQDYRPAERTDAVLVRHPKTGVKGWVPLEDDGRQLFPELEAFLAELPRLGVPIILTQGRRGPPRPYSAEYAQRKVREARAKASLGEHVTLDACRHGGLTELGDAGVTEFEGMAASMHKTPGALRLYVKRSETQRLNAARKRRAHVASGG